MSCRRRLGSFISVGLYPSQSDSRTFDHLFCVERTGGTTTTLEVPLMRRFAKAGNRVIFVNSISMACRSGQQRLAAPDARKLRSYARLARSTRKASRSYRPRSFLFCSRAARATNRNCSRRKSGDSQSAAVCRGPFFGLQSQLPPK